MSHFLLERDAAHRPAIGLPPPPPPPQRPAQAEAFSPVIG